MCIHPSISILRLKYCPHHIWWGLQQQAMPDTVPPCVCPVGQVNSRQAWLSDLNLHTFGPHLSRLFLTSGAGGLKSVTDLIQLQGMAHCTCSDYMSCQLRSTGVISSMPSFWSSEAFGFFVSVFCATEPADHGTVIAAEPLQVRGIRSPRVATMEHNQKDIGNVYV